MNSKLITSLLGGYLTLSTISGNFNNAYAIPKIVSDKKKEEPKKQPDKKQEDKKPEKKNPQQKGENLPRKNGASEQSVENNKLTSCGLAYSDLNIKPTKDKQIVGTNKATVQLNDSSTIDYLISEDKKQYFKFTDSEGNTTQIPFEKYPKEARNHFLTICKGESNLVQIIELGKKGSVRSNAYTQLLRERIQKEEKENNSWDKYDTLEKLVEATKTKKAPEGNLPEYKVLERDNKGKATKVKEGKVEIDTTLYGNVAKFLNDYHTGKIKTEKGKENEVLWTGLKEAFDKDNAYFINGNPIQKIALLGTHVYTAGDQIYIVCGKTKSGIPCANEFVTAVMAANSKDNSFEGTVNGMQKIGAELELPVKNSTPISVEIYHYIGGGQMDQVYTNFKSYVMGGK